MKTRTPPIEARSTRALHTTGWGLLLLGGLLWTGFATAARGDGFVDVAASLGIDFRHEDGRNGRYYFPETIGSGGGWIDHDGDGDLDLYLVNGAATPGSDLAEAPRNALYENRDGRFVDVTAVAGVGDLSYGMGFCAADYDADGRVDFLVTNLGKDRLYRNLGPGGDGGVRFEERAEAAGVAGAASGAGAWSVSCAFGDLDGDGDLDLYVTRYVDFSYDSGPDCSDQARKIRSYCHPDHFSGVPDALYINQGDGTFRSEGSKRGLAQSTSERGLGVTLSDLDNDGDLDIYVANDSSANRFYQNRGDATFTDLSLLSGTALSESGARQAGMGIATGDADGDGRMELVVTNYSLEANNYYVNLGDGLFEDRGRASGIADLGFRDLGWGVGFLDFDLDGDLDLAVANGHIMDNIELFVPGLTYAQKNRLLAGDGRGGFREVGAAFGSVWQVEKVSRGLAVGDFDNDGRPDLLITHSNDAPTLLENRVATKNRWLGLDLRGPAANPFAVGARVELRSGERRQVREVRSGGGVLTQGDPRLLFGLGAGVESVDVEIRWPDGHVQRESTRALDRYWRIEQRRK